jgi:hypothetical protein
VTRRSPLAALATLLIAAAAPALAQDASQSTVFRRLLLLEDTTSASIKQLLRHDGGFVRPIDFSDLTGDGKADAVVMVASGGASGNVALYVLTADGLKGKKGTGTLRSVYRVQSLYRATARVTGTAVVYTSPRYARGNDVYRPSRTIQRTLRWTKSTGRFRVTSTRTV